MKLIDVFGVILVAVLWGIGFIVAKAGMDHFTPILLMALRFTVTAVCLVWFFLPPLKFLKQLFVIALISATLQYSLTSSGVAGIDASTAALLVQLEVPFGLLTAWVLLGKKLVFGSVGMAVAFTGAILIIGEPKLSNDLKYMFLVIAGAFTWAVGQVIIKKLGQVGGFVLISGIVALAAPQLFVASFLLEDNQLAQIQTAPIGAWAAVAYLDLIMTALYPTQFGIAYWGCIPLTG